MPAYLCCPSPHCLLRIPDGTTAAEAMTDHLIAVHGLPKTSASFQAHIVLQPVHGAS